VQELVIINKVREAFHKLGPIPCPSCRACMPCPQGIDVPRIFELYNDAFIYNDAEMARSLYYDEQHSVDNCTECGACENACAKRLAMLDWLKKAHRLLAKVG
jgi:predicted aldo/keto reductase-like oxidoreductase